MSNDIDNPDDETAEALERLAEKKAEEERRKRESDRGR